MRVSLLAILPFALASNAFADCDAVLQYVGLKNFESFSSESLVDMDYYLNCTEEGKSRSGSLGVVFEAIEVNLGASSYSEAKQCEERSRNISVDSVRSIVASEPVAAAISAWTSCILAKSQNIDISIGDSQATVAVKVENPTTGPLTFYANAVTYQMGAAVQAIDKCQFLPPESLSEVNSTGMGTFEVLPKTAVNIVCSRDAAIEDRAGLYTRFFPRVDLNIFSQDSSNFSFPFIESVISAEGLERLASVEAKLLELSKLIGNFTSRTMYACPYNSNSPVDGAWLSVGCVGQISDQSTCKNIAWRRIGGGIAAVDYECSLLSVVLLP